ncbi:serine threonine- kinase 2 19-like isoform A [Chlorella sorokiniana]|uniref:non-specific serine/threonine protein kinase n=1 Tax=Chlorella sorokiniana TaxID=3076 RepID=A0A2P6TMV4_CHLSO|nr:serine threonine- kinase 2 19-like isoform A [Chlorella sorokiniana]|eukprot:PRW45661.1 serine threonine- kinase 2 19-like isoform A [Chlorella sorokiniana]
MPGTKQLNPFAHSFVPPSGPALAPPADRLAAIRLGGGAVPDRAAAADRGGPIPDAGFALWSGCASHRLTGAVRQSHQDEVAEEGDLELEPHFQEDEEERSGSEARRASTCSSTEASPHTSFVGPSPLPSPAKPSPVALTGGLHIAVAAAAAAGNAKAAGLLAQTEDPPSSFKAAAETAALAASTEVVTYVETEASAELASTSGRRRLGPNDFEMLRIVGQGAFGKVFQVRKRDTSEIFAMKVMRKDRILERDHKDYVRAERDVLTSVLHPYIVTLRYSFQTPKKLYLVLDFINGGHLFFQLYRQGTFDEALARLYTAEIVLAIAHLHSLGFVHRDLKPENVLLDSEGHVRITDFGLAKGNVSDAEHERTNSFIGTMEYMAPEVITGRGHGKAVDWWSVGILLYEMLNGMPPFRAKGRTQLQKLITAAKFKLPSYLSSEVQSLVKGLLQKEPAKRLGYGPSGSADVMGHPFFKGMDWRKLEARQIISPFRPNVRSIESIDNFDKIWTDLPPTDSPCATPRESSLQDHMFENFTYCAESFLAVAVRSEEGSAGATGGLLMKTIAE